MLRRTLINAARTMSVGSSGVVQQQWRMLSEKASPSISSAVNSMIFRSLKDHYLQVANMPPPPKVSPPAEFTIVKGALESHGPVLRRQFNNEEISISVMRLANIVEGNDDVDDDGAVNQLFLHVDVSKPGKDNSLNFLCALFPDALGIHSVSLRPKSDKGLVLASKQFTGPPFENLDEKMRDSFYKYIEERGINENLFSFLRAWLYVKDNRNLLRWFKSVVSVLGGRK